MHFFKKEKVVVVGAGISGFALALLLARQGHSVLIYDKRTGFDLEKEGRSINFTVSGRGLTVLAQLGLKETVLAHSAVLVGRALHLKNSKTIHYKYGTQKSQVLLSIRRSTLIDILLNAVAHESNITLHLGFELSNIDEETLTCHFLNVATKEVITQKAGMVIGADGVFSTVRSFMLKKQIASYQQTVFNWGYKEYQFDRHEAEKLALSTDHMHMWPKSDALLVAIPNTDHTFSVIFTAPLRDNNGELNNFDELVKREFQDIVSTAPSFLNKCGLDPCNYLVSVKVDKWHLDDKIVLIGDACHATYPFYGQGMNSALEDAIQLNNHINDKSLSLLEAFSAYEKTRKRESNALHQLSEAHLHQMTKAMISPFWQACNVLDYQLAKLLPRKWIYEYEMVAHSAVNYSNVIDIVKRQDKKKLISGFYITALILSVIICAQQKCNDSVFLQRMKNKIAKRIRVIFRANIFNL
ncbi:MAG: NAD(P)/FAD-dependent oxidoreductase [Gammaproteobacteria bacterium]|nr:NAD(P)/FAD-dependent oxidoreductase [Gammaproteobacteria bacterium]